MKVATFTAIFAAFTTSVTFAAPAEDGLILEREAIEDSTDALNAGGEMVRALAALLTRGYLLKKTALPPPDEGQTR